MPLLVKILFDVFQSRWPPTTKQALPITSVYHRWKMHTWKMFLNLKPTAFQIHLIRFEQKMSGTPRLSIPNHRILYGIKTYSTLRLDEEIVWSLETIGETTDKWKQKCSNFILVCERAQHVHCSFQRFTSNCLLRFLPRCSHFLASCPEAMFLNGSQHRCISSFARLGTL